MKSQLDNMRREVVSAHEEMGRLSSENDKIVGLYKKLNDDLKRECRLYIAQIQQLTTAPPRASEISTTPSQVSRVRGVPRLEPNPPISTALDDFQRPNPFSPNFAFESGLSTR